MNDGAICLNGTERFASVQFDELPSRTFRVFGIRLFGAIGCEA